MGVDAKKPNRILKARIKLGERVGTLIREHGYPSMESFALANALPKATLHQVLKGIADPRYSTLLRIADALEIPIEEMIKNCAPNL